MEQYNYIEAYTPASGQITSTALGGKKLKSAHLYLSADATVTFKAIGSGSSSAAIALPGQTFIKINAIEVSVVSVGTLYLCHNGELLHPGE